MRVLTDRECIITTREGMSSVYETSFFRRECKATGKPYWFNNADKLINNTLEVAKLEKEYRENHV